MAQNDLPIWITAAATVMTAVLTGTGGLAAWLALRRERMRELPIVERSVRWRADYLEVSLTLRNRLPETIILDSIEVIKPRGATVNKGHGEYTTAGRVGPATKGASPLMKCGYETHALGSQSSSHSTGDRSYWTFSVWPEAAWKAGPLKIAIRISSKADTIRNRRIVIKVIVPAAINKQSDEAASNHA